MHTQLHTHVSPPHHFSRQTECGLFNGLPCHALLLAHFWKMFSRLLHFALYFHFLLVESQMDEHTWLVFPESNWMPQPPTCAFSVLKHDREWGEWTEDVAFILGARSSQLPNGVSPLPQARGSKERFEIDRRLHLHVSNECLLFNYVNIKSLDNHLLFPKSVWFSVYRYSITNVSKQ